MEDTRMGNASEVPGGARHLKRPNGSHCDQALISMFTLAAARSMILLPMKGLCVLRLALLFLPVLLLAQTESEKLQKIFAGEEAEYQREHPRQVGDESSTLEGSGGWADESAATFERRREQRRQRLAGLRALNREALAAQDRLNYDLLVYQLDQEVNLDRFPHELLKIGKREGPASTVASAFQRAQPRTIADYEATLTRLRGVPKYIDQYIARLKRGIGDGVVKHDVAVNGLPARLEALASPELSTNPLFEPFRRFPKNIPPADQERLAKEAGTVFDGQVWPALRKFRDFIAKEYLPHTAKSIARSALPNGQEWYAAEIRWHTTTAMTPEQIHQLGLDEVKRIRVEMDVAMRKTGFEGNFAAFLQHLRTDPKFYFTRAEDLLAAHRDLSKRIDPELLRLFGKLPRTPYGVRPFPEAEAPTATSGLYSRSRGGRPAWMSVNTYKLESRPKYEMEALTLHEAVPGHHLQRALQQEMLDVPKFRERAQVNAFSEGWGLYAESLGEELGFYLDPYSKFGQLSMEIWRACRLVVDTGMHALGWSRQRAIDYLTENTGLAEHNVGTEIDRYIDEPGQALAYKIGELKIKELRRLAETELGSRFDIRAFHDAVLANGSIPLAVLETEIRRWIEMGKPKA